MPARRARFRPESARYRQAPTRALLTGMLRATARAVAVTLAPPEHSPALCSKRAMEASAVTRLEASSMPVATDAAFASVDSATCGAMAPAAEAESRVVSPRAPGWPKLIHGLLMVEPNAANGRRESTRDCSSRSRIALLGNALQTTTCPSMERVQLPQRSACSGSIHRIRAISECSVPYTTWQPSKLPSSVRPATDRVYQDAQPGFASR